MITVKMLAHKGQDVYSLTREEGIRFFKDISKDGTIFDPIEVRKGFLMKETEEEDSEELKFNYVLSTGDIDRDDERILTAGWDINNYMKNPVLLWSHDPDRPAIGYMENIKVGKDALSGTAVFVDKTIDHFGWSIGQKVKSGIIRAGSVGFMPKEWKFIDDANDPAWLEFQKQELYEFSICNVPANPKALVQDEVMEYPFKKLDSIETMLQELTSALKRDDNEDTKNVLNILSRAASTVKELRG